MIKFLRKHQRIFFIIITVVIVITFSFFGTYSVTQRDKGPKDRNLTTSINGTTIKFLETQKLSLMLANNYYSGLTNLFNKNILSEDFIDTGIAKVLVKNYFNVVKPYLESHFDRIKKTNLFTHAQYKNISVENVWQQYCPEMLTVFNRIKEAKEVNETFFADLLRLYVLQDNLPPMVLKRILYYQMLNYQQQYGNTAADYELVNNDFYLFGFKSASEWFGHNFIDLVSEFVLNVADLAKSSGCKVLTEEVYSYLISTLKENLERIENADRFPKDLKSCFQYQCRLLGMKVNDVIDAGEKILLFKKYFNDKANAVFVDTQLNQQLVEFTHKQAEVTAYKLPSYLSLQDSEKQYLLALYWQCVGKEPLTDQYYPIEQIKEKYPEFLQKTVQIKCVGLTKEEAGLSISEKALWDWQTKEENWQQLITKFPELKKNKKEPFEALEELSSSVRHHVDAFSRSKMLSDEFILAALKKKEMKDVTLKINAKDKCVDGLVGINDVAQLMLFLQSKEHSQKYTQDNETYYLFQEMKEQDSLHLLTFEDLLSDGSLRALLQNKLKEAHKSNYTDKSFNEAKPLLLNMLFPIDVKSQFLSYMDKLCSQLQQNKDDFLFKDGRRTVANQWQIEKEDKVLDKTDYKDSPIFTEKVGFITKPLIEGSSILFYRVNNFKTDEEAVLKELQKEKTALSNEVKLHLAEQVMIKILEKNAILLPIRENV